eukprot:COSAG02_NODE_65539_length_258_cov_0.226415_1_plen_48_part_10
MGSYPPLPHVLHFAAPVLPLLVTNPFFKQKTAYEILRSDWSSDVCSSD